MMRSIAGLAVALALCAATPSAEAFEGSAIQVAAFYGGKQACAVNTAGAAPHMVRCCPTATHEINVRRRYLGSTEKGRGRFVTEVTRIQFKPDQEFAKVKQ